MGIKRFFLKHSGELSSIASVISLLVRAIPIDRQDKQRVIDIANNLETAAENIAKSANEMADIGDSISKADIMNAVKEVLPDIIAEVTKAIISRNGGRNGDATAGEITISERPQPKPRKAKRIAAPK